MKITDLKILRMSTPTQAHTNWTFVKIETDAGIYGLGEASLQYKDAALIAELEAFKRFLLGKDPFQIEHIWTSLHRRVTWTGGPVTVSAISAIDLALWDIKGKALGVPVYELLGGKSRDRVRVYANGWLAGARGPDEHAARASQVVSQGYTCLKFYPFSGEQVITPQRIERGISLVRAVREAVGPMCEIGIDVRARLNIWSARRVAYKLEPFDVAWIEEPILFDNPDAMAALAREIRIPVSTGEQLYTRWEFRALLERNAIGIIQPDICHAGGLTELKKIAAAAETYYVTVAPHNSNGPISTVASLHLDMCIPNCFMQEVFLNFLPRYNEVLTKPIEIVDGHCTPPDGPGWGTDLREDVLRQYPPGPYTPVESEPYRKF
jgi:galactonate dehydratase